MYNISLIAVGSNLMRQITEIKKYNTDWTLMKKKLFSILHSIRKNIPCFVVPYSSFRLVAYRLSNSQHVKTQAIAINCKNMKFINSPSVIENLNKVQFERWQCIHLKWKLSFGVRLVVCTKSTWTQLSAKQRVLKTRRVNSPWGQS